MVLPAIFVAAMMEEENAAGTSLPPRSALVVTGDGLVDDGNIQTSFASH
jgi:hypothetical protein